MKIIDLKSVYVISMIVIVIVFGFVFGSDLFFFFWLSHELGPGKKPT